MIDGRTPKLVGLVFDDGVTVEVDDAEDAVDQIDSLLYPEASPAAKVLGRYGGLKGGPARSAKLSPKRRKEIARKAALARWRKP